ncbi:MAG: DUF975 family protein [Oscillospiraceae bacterium]|nr:DUF975 family protein [Oscillospiraceae bacterium]
MTRQELKTQAKDIFRRRIKAILIASLIYVVLSLAVSEFSSYAMGQRRVLAYINTVRDTISAEHYALINFDANEVYGNIFRLFNTVGIAISVVVGILVNVLFAGYRWFLLRTKRGEEPSVTAVFSSFSKTGKLALLIILQTLFISLWLMLFVIPGIFAALRYSQAVYIMYDHPEYSALECIRESKRMMRGMEGSYFTLLLSFIGWYLLSAVVVVFAGAVIPDVGEYIGTYVIGVLFDLFLVPYAQLTFAGYYDDLRRNAHSQNDDLYL